MDFLYGIKRIASLSITLLLVLLSFPGELRAFDFGGKVIVSSGLSYFDDDWTADLSGSSELELYFPHSAAVMPRLVLHGNLADQSSNFGVKYLYLRRRMEHRHLTIGRQPVSWSYGAMLNLLDYGMGIEDLANETVTPGIDGLRYHHSLGEGRSVQAVLSLPSLPTVDLDELGYGFRLRLPGSGWDFSFVSSYQPVTVLTQPQQTDRLLRTGITLRGDVGEIGVYGGLGYFTLRQGTRDDFLVQLGMDYSWLAGEFKDQQVLLQAEYIRFLHGEMSLLDLVGLIASNASDGWDGGSGGASLFLGNDLLLVNLSTQPDFFTTLGLAAMVETNNWATVFTSYYTTDLGGGLEMRINGNWVRFGEGNYTFRIAAGLTYYF